jgi:hypothetical protein
MATTADDVLKDALQLTEGERARVAGELLASLEPDIETRDGEAWIAEVERRAQAASAVFRALAGRGPDAGRGAHFPSSKVSHVRFAPEVPDELAEAVVWYEAKRQGLGEEFLDEIRATLPLLGSRPRSFLGCKT